MSTYQHILLAIDYSKQNNDVAEKARQIATQNQAKLSIVHVIEHIANDNDNLMHDLFDAEQSSLAEIADKLDINAANQWLKTGIPAKEIVELAQVQAVDLIVMGAHHHHGFSRLLGSPSTDTLKRTPCDLLAVHLA
jgi:universal stress protein A